MSWNPEPGDLQALGDGSEGQATAQLQSTTGANQADFEGALNDDIVKQLGVQLASLEKPVGAVYHFQGNVYVTFQKARESVPAQIILHTVTASSCEAEHVYHYR